MVLGEVVDGAGEVFVTRLHGADQRWDLSFEADDGVSQDIYGPVVDCDRPDQATTYGDISFIHDGQHDRWKPYITRDGRLAIRVTSEAKVEGP